MDEFNTYSYEWQEIPPAGFEHLHVDRDFSLLDGFATMDDPLVKAMDDFQSQKADEYMRKAMEGLGDLTTFLKPNMSLWDFFEKPKKQKKFRSIDDPWESS